MSTNIAGNFRKLYLLSQIMIGLRPAWLQPESKDFIGQSIVRLVDIQVSFILSDIAGMISSSHEYTSL